MQVPKLEFWYDFASTYSYLSAMRIETLAVEAGQSVAWRPFLLGPIFQAQGWNTSPFNIYPAKGRYMIRDMQRLAAERGLSFSQPAAFPQNSLAAARIALVAEEAGCIGEFTRAVYLAAFADGQDIGQPSTLTGVVDRMTPQFGLDSARIIARSADPLVKQHLKVQTAEAATLGVFGAPTFRTPDGELFWGDDRLHQAVAWTQRTKTAAL